MQDEIIKHTEKIYKTATSPGHSFFTKIKEILIEIFIIVFAVTLSIWLHSWSEHRHQKKEADEFLMDTRDDLKKDMENMKERKQNLSSILKTYRRILTLSAKDLDTIKNISINFSLVTFKANDGNYEGFKSSGKIGYIENKALKKLILEYYQEYLPALYEVDKYHYAKHLEIWEMISSSDRGQTLSNPLLKAKIGLDAQITDALIKTNDSALANAQKIEKEIDRELSN